MSVDPHTVLFEDVKGLEEAKAIVKRALINPVRYPDVYKSLKLVPGSGLLLYGPPGTGKTMFARAIANELNCKFYSASLEDLRGKTPLQTAEKISMLFDTARNNKSGSVLFIDDCEELLSRPGNAKAYGVSQFLTELDGLKVAGNSKNVFVLIATNRPWMIDGALLRSGRISASAYIGLPEIDVRREIIASALHGIILADDVDVELLAEYTEGYSGAEIYHSLNGGGICNLARDYAADRWVKRIEIDPAAKAVIEPVTMADFERAISQIVPCAVKEQERIAKNEAFYATFTSNAPENYRGFACRTRGGHTLSFSLPDAMVLKNFVFNSSTIQTVPDYKHLAEKVFFYLSETDSDSNKFNAFATTVGFLKQKYDIKELEDEDNLARPAILLHDGLDIAYTVVAAAYMLYSDNMVLTNPEKLRTVLIEMNSLLYSKKGHFGKKQLEILVKKFDLLPEDSEVLANIKTLASAMIAFVIAHELGHIIHGDMFNGMSNGVYSRNMERAADQFAADTLNGLEDPKIREFMFLGAALSFVADSSLGNADVSIAAEDDNSHPATLERFNSLLKNAPPTLELFNLTESVFLACMP